MWPFAKVLGRYRELNAKPQGPNDEPWPAGLLPIAEADPAVYCFDLSKESVVVHDVQEMDHLGRGEWERSFSQEAPSLADWLEHWLGSTTFDAHTAQVMNEVKAKQAARGVSPVTGYPTQLDDPAQQAEAEISFLAHSPDLRIDFGLPASGWEEEVRRRHGLT